MRPTPSAPLCQALAECLRTAELDDTTRAHQLDPFCAGVPSNAS
jgi:hypothetical protein